MLESEGVADRDHEVADLELRGIREADLGRQGRVLDAEHRDVRALVRAHDLGLELDVVHERDRDFTRILDDVRVRHDVAVPGIDDDAGAGAAEFAVALLRIRRQAEEAAKARVVEERVARRGDRALDADVDDGGDTRLITGAKEGSADCAETPEETPNAAMASKAAKNFFIENNLDGARCLTGRRRHKFRCAIALIFPRADASVNELCVFCAYFVHTRCGTARKIGPDRPEARPGRKQP